MIDIHRHFYFGKASAEALLCELERDGIAKTALFGYHGMRLLPREHQQDEEVLALAERFPGRILPFCCDFDLGADDAGAYLAQCARQGFRGLGEILLGHTPLQRAAPRRLPYDDAACLRVFRAAGACHLPVLAHADPAFSGEFLSAAEQCPQTCFIWAHIGYDFTGEYGGSPLTAQQAEALLDRHPNLYAELSTWKISPVYLCEAEWQSLLERRSDRFLLGFDMSEDYGTERVWIAAYQHVLSGLSKPARERICTGNAERLFGL